MTEPVRPVEAATVILVRRGRPVGKPWQCFMVRRHIKSDFAANVYVFPGGKIDDADRSPELGPYTLGHPGPEWPGDVRSWRAVRAAAIRELFEEAGVLLAHRRDGSVLRMDRSAAERFAMHRDRLHAEKMSLVDLARREGLVYQLDALHALSRWITPETFPRRFDTYFFVALLPAGQEPAHDAGETTHGVWIAPQKALDRFRRGKFPLVFATEKHLERLARYPSIEELIASSALADLTPVMPREKVVNGEKCFLIPGDPEY